MKRLLFILFAISLIGGCKSEESIDPALESLGRASGPVEQKAGAPPMQPMPGDRPMMPPHGMNMMQKGGGGGKVHAGEVLETMDAARYTYVKMKTESGEELWSAIPKAEIAVGQQVEVVESIVMKDFQSPTLKRNFSTIVFGTLRGAENAGEAAGESQEQGGEAKEAAQPVASPK